MKKPVSRRALEERIRRSLKKEERTLHRNSRGPYMERMGDYYVVDLRTNAIEFDFSDLEEFGRQEGVLKGWEELVD